MNKRVALVTGATGFIGKYVITCLLNEGMRVFALTRTRDAINSLLDGGVEIVNGDITDKFAIPVEVNTIYHCAGVIADEEKMRPVNILGTKNIVEAALEYSCRLIHLSSAGVVGMTKRKRVDETTSCNPENLYEITKYEAEKIVLKGIERGLKAQILRPTIVFGKGREPQKDSFLQLIRTIAAGRYRHINKGRGIYNIVYAGEVARAMFALDNDNIPNGKVYFINTPVSFSEFALIVLGSIKDNNEKIGNIPYSIAFTAAIVFSLMQILTEKKRGLTFSRLKALTEARIFSQERLLNETDYRPSCSVDEYLKQICCEYQKSGFFA
jgi:nucleoside-diphosphate-sugar epimerase